MTTYAERVETRIVHPTRFDQCYGALLGLAMGDALGWPAMYHRTLLTRRPKRRQRLWQFSAEADGHQVNKMALPFTLSQPEALLHLCPTDDTEFAAISALILEACGDDVSPERLFAGWEREIIAHGDTVWSGIGERASIENARKGLRPPRTGSDNPHHFDDGAVARAVPIGLRYADDSDRAIEVAGWMASITNDADGVWAAQAMAASIAAAVQGQSPSEIVAVGQRQLPPESWAARKVTQALSLLDQAGSGFAAIPLWNNTIVNSIYSFGNVAPETLAVAYAIFLSADGQLQTGLQLAAMVPKQADSMPAMVGALCGAYQGLAAIPETWQHSLDTLKGVCIPHLEGRTLHEIAEILVGRE